MRKHGFRTVAVFTIVLSIFGQAMAQTAAFDTTRLERSADACDNFYQFANGNWIKTTTIPASQPRWGTFNILADKNQTILKDILEKSMLARGRAGSDTQLIGDMYDSCMNETAIQAASAQPIKGHLTRIDGVTDRSQLPSLIADLHAMGIPMFFAFGGGPDLKNSSMTIANLSQGGLSLPNRDFYDRDDAKSKETRQKFVAYVEKMFSMLGESPEIAAASAKSVMTIQTRLAGASKRPVDMRNPDNRYNKKTVADAQKLTPSFSWATYTSTRKAPPVSEVNVGQPDFFKEFEDVVRDVALSEIKSYMRFMVANAAAPRLSKNFVDAHFDFFNRTLTGVQEQQPRWKRCVSTVDSMLGEALGMAYVKQYFTPATKKRADEMIGNLFVAFGERLQTIDWMSAETKKEAARKLSTFKRKIGYPDKLLGYSGLKITRKSYFDNSVNAARFLTTRNMNDINNPVDRTRWGFSTPTINASYNSVNNDITFPAGILQPPFFSFTADDAINYGGIGGVIGHEISHGFDDSGSRFDADGNLKMWWTPEDRKRFDDRASCVADQFSKYEIQPELFINGRLTLGENIGDLGGLEVAYTAFKNSMKGRKRPADIDGFSPEQRFFLGWAQVWGAKATPEFERQQVLTDPHSHARYRVNGPLSNMPEFAEAFGCKAPAKMISDKICEIW